MNLFSSLLLAALNVAPAPFDNGLMVNVPGYGYSRVETVSFCLGQVGVDKYQDLITDSDYSKFGACLEENT